MRIGVVGMGAAAHAFIAPLRQHAGFDWVALAETEPTTRERCAAQHGVAGFADVAAMLANVRLDAVYIATPTALHAAQAIAAARAGKHVLVEKPMAVSLDDARAMVAAAEAAGVALLVGHSHSFDAPIAAMRAVIESGELGAVGMVNTWCYSDWMNRPRRADEFNAAQGGGVTFRQGAHQFDIVRLLCGGMARSVRARCFAWRAAAAGVGGTGSIGAHQVFIDFANGAAATVVYNGYGGFSSMDLCGDISEWGLHMPPDQRVRERERLRAPDGVANDDAALHAKRERATSAIATQAAHQPHFGITLVSCERGDMRQSPQGLQIFTPEGMRDVAVPLDKSPRELVLDEFHGVITGRRAPLHDGRWGLANLEIVHAALASSASGRDVALHEQVAPGVPVLERAGWLSSSRP